LDALKRMGREHGGKQRQAKGINDNLVVRTLGAPGRRLVDLRNKALVAVAGTALARRSELVALLAEDLRIAADGFGVVTIRKSKTDPTGDGASVAITVGSMYHLQARLAAARIESYPLFVA
jgi:hypothetical protein